MLSEIAVSTELSDLSKDRRAPNFVQVNFNRKIEGKRMSR